MAISPPPGFEKDPNSETWWFDPTGDPNARTTWWEMPPAGFVSDPNSPGWYFDPSKDIAHDPSAWWHDNSIIDDPVTAPLSFWTFEEIGAAAGVSPSPNVSDNWPHICRAAGLWGIAEPLVLIGFLGTMMKETGSLYPVREAWWVWNVDRAAAIRYYENTNLHAAYGGGWLYHGRGYVQLTHASNYQNVQNRLAGIGVNVDLVNNPDLLLEPEYAAHALAIYFIDRGLVDFCNARDWGEVRYRVWGGRGDADGVGKLQRCETMLLPLAQSRGFA